jgi:hypothetical protein
VENGVAYLSKKYSVSILRLASVLKELVLAPRTLLTTIQCVIKTKVCAQLLHLNLSKKYLLSAKYKARRMRVF